ncbi:MAG: hypothetical protein ABL857_00350 [Rickettsiales bacterium]
MKSITKNIVWTNIAIVAIIYIFAFSEKTGVVIGFFATSLQVAINIGIAIIISIIHLANECKNQNLGKAVKGFWISAGLVLLISFPACLLVGEIHPLRIAG